MEIKKLILEIIKEASLIRESNLADDLNENSILLESGLDSLGYAIVVTRLEEELGYDPFSLMEEPIYPQTLKEFIEIYDKFKD